MERLIGDLAMSGATDGEICDYLAIAPAVLDRYRLALKRSRASRRISLRRSQTSVALKGNVGMLTLLGKHELGQTRATASGEPDDAEPELEPKVG
jgi:hypothetical protein